MDESWANFIQNLNKSLWYLPNVFSVLHFLVLTKFCLILFHKWIKPFASHKYRHYLLGKMPFVTKVTAPVSSLVGSRLIRDKCLVFEVAERQIEKVFWINFSDRKFYRPETDCIDRPVREMTTPHLCWRLPFRLQIEWLNPGKTNWLGRHCTFDLLVKVACFVKR